MIRVSMYALCAISVLLSGCGKEKTEDTKNQTPVSQETPVSITPMYTEEEIKIKALYDFSKKYPSFTNVSVTDVSLTEGFQFPGNKEKVNGYGITISFTVPSAVSVVQSFNKEEQKLSDSHATQVHHVYNAATNELVFESVFVNESDDAHTHAEEDGHTHADGETHTHAEEDGHTHSDDEIHTH